MQKLVQIGCVLDLKILAASAREYGYTSTNNLGRELFVESSSLRFRFFTKKNVTDVYYENLRQQRKDSFKLVQSEFQNIYNRYMEKYRTKK